MPNFNTHVAAGLVAALLLAVFLYYSLGTSPLVLAFGVVLALVATEFPDIDHKRSMPRKILRGIIPGLVIFLLIYFVWTGRMWQGPILNLVVLTALALIFIFAWERFIPRHRGPTHKLPGLVFLVVSAAAFAYFLGLGTVSLAILVAFSVLGFVMHVILDHL
jgi:membrane-bound metal-dependent hydrolase YbcI (DUF457 family)